MQGRPDLGQIDRQLSQSGPGLNVGEAELTQRLRHLVNAAGGLIKRGADLINFGVRLINVDADLSEICAVRRVDGGFWSGSGDFIERHWRGGLHRNGLMRGRARPMY